MNFFANILLKQNKTLIYNVNKYLISISIVLFSNFCLISILNLNTMSKNRQIVIYSQEEFLQLFEIEILFSKFLISFGNCFQKQQMYNQNNQPPYGYQPQQPSYGYHQPQPQRYDPQPPHYQPPPQHDQQHRYDNFDMDNQDFKRDDYNNEGSNWTNTLYEDSRSGFIRKVYTILSLQLLITVLVCLWAINSQTFKKIFVNTAAMIIISIALMAVSCVIGCCYQQMKKYGLIFLILFTVLFSLFVGIACAISKPEIVATAAGITCVVVIALTAYACITKTDFTNFGPYLMVFCMVLFLFGIVLIFWRNEVAHLIYACLAALLFSVYLIFDTQMILGRGQFSYGLDDAYFAAMQLYTDIVQLFLQILQILTAIDR